ncbi:MAG: hypothetical protein ACLR7Z_20800 [Bilophila wadsworthia]
MNMTKDGQLDAIVWVGPGESWFFTEIAQNVDLVWLPVDEKIMDDVARSTASARAPSRLLSQAAWWARTSRP